LGVPNRVVIATKNPDKLREVRAVLAEAVPGVEVADGLDWPDVEETGATLAENALLKAEAVVAATGLAAIADDTGLEVDALGGAPGVHTSRYAGPDAGYAENRRALLEAMDGVLRRSARFRTVVVLATPEGPTAAVEGILEGTITESERGAGGFGYDPVFEVGGRTLAEIPEDEKNRISHRGRALRSLADLLLGGNRDPG
jgi:XTP/dITP diphosphohydrolase